MANRLSHSATSKYGLCPRMYRYHYVDKLRPKGISSALLFGKAIDHAIGISLNGGDSQKAFDEAWLQQEYKGELVKLADLDELEYYKSDLDLDLLNLDLRAKLDERKPNSVANIEEALSWVKQEAFKKVPDDVRRYWKYACYLSLQVKGELMLQAFDRDHKPRIKRVIATQHQVALENAEGDSTVGYIDLIAELDSGQVAIIDIKTAARPYEEDSVRESAQLALYSFSSDIEHDCCAYMVISKAIKKEYKKICSVCFVENTSSHKTCANVEGGKRCGGEFNIDQKLYAETQFILDKVSDNVKEMVVENFNDINRAIKHEIYPRNLDRCSDVFGKKCSYYNSCFHKDNSELEQE